MLKGPLEQFEILSLLTLKINSLDFSITNFLLINLLTLIVFSYFVYFNNSNIQTSSFKKSFIFFNPNAWQVIIENISETSIQLISDIIKTDKEKYVPVIYIIFNFILFSNLIGLIPYTFTTTSHIIVTFTLSFSVFIGITLIIFQKYKMMAFSLFLPKNSQFFLALILVPIEFISYIARPISLGMRLFINLMAGHSLLKVIIVLLLENKTSIGLLFPIIIVIILFGLELSVALIQTYVFGILTCIYISEIG